MKSKSSCNKTSNNKYFDCPARMDDGRTFTDYRQNSTVNDMIRYSNNTMSSYEYRQFLIHNASKIMEVNNTYLKEKVGCDSCDYVEVPFQTTCTWNETFGKCAMTDPNGVGLRNIIHEKFENGQGAFNNFSQNIGPNNQGFPVENYENGQGAFNNFSQNIGPNNQEFPVENYENGQGAFNETVKNVGWNTGAYEPFQGNLDVPSGTQMAYNSSAKNIGWNTGAYEPFGTYKKDA
jgi:hypothetical protein